MKNPFGPQHLWYLLPFLVFGLAIYSKALEVPFYFDDLSNIVENPHIRLDRLSIDGLMGAAFQSLSSSRPVANISFALNYYIHEYDVAGYHVVNIIIHILAGIFLFLFIKTTLQLSAVIPKSSNASSSQLPKFFSEAQASAASPASRPLFFVALIGALIWFVHPVHAQSVTYVVQRMNSMASMFYVLSILLYVHGRLNNGKRAQWMWFAGAAFAGILSAGSKQIAATLPFFILLYEWYFFRGLNRAWAKRFILYLIGPVMALAILSYLYTGLNPLQKLLSTSVDVDCSAGERLLTQFRVVIHYISLLVYPHPSRLHLDYDFVASQSLLKPISTLFSLIAVLGLLGLALYLARRDRLTSFCILWFLGNLVIESVVSSLEIVYEHRTYLPSMLIFVPVAAVGYTYWKYKKTAMAAAAIIVVVFSVWTYERNIVWLDPVAFWGHCAEKSTRKARPYLNFASALASRGRVDEAIPRYREALRRNPDYEHAHIGLGSALVKKGLLDEALAHYLKALRIRPEHAMVHYGLGVVYARRGEFDDAAFHYRKALVLDSTHVNAMNNLGVVLAQTGRWDEAISYYRKVLRLNPEHPTARRNLKNALAMSKRTVQAVERHRPAVAEDITKGVEALNAQGISMTGRGKLKEAASLFNQALEIAPEDAETHYNLGVVLAMLDRLDEAGDHYLDAIRIRPRYAEAHNNVGIIFGRQGRLQKAVEHFEKALDIKPDFVEARKNLQSAQSLRGQR